jgi:hypothetical protein
VHIGEVIVAVVKLPVVSVYVPKLLGFSPTRIFDAVLTSTVEVASASMTGAPVNPLILVMGAVGKEIAKSTVLPTRE